MKMQPLDYFYKACNLGGCDAGTEHTSDVGRSGQRDRSGSL